MIQSRLQEADPNPNYNIRLNVYDIISYIIFSTFAVMYYIMDVQLSQVTYLSKVVSVIFTICLLK